MKKIALAFATAAILLTGTAVQAKPKLTGEEKLAKMLEGRVAGEPVSCIPITGSQNTRIIDKTALVYESGKTLYVNRPNNPDSLDDDYIHVTELHGSQLCRLDTVRLHDRSGFWYSGFVGLNDFVPYRKPKKD